MSARDHVVVLPGGGYWGLADHEGDPVVSWLQELGISASRFDYPVQQRHPAPNEAIASEVARVRADGAERVGLLGFSAGAHAAGLAAYAPALPEARVDLAVLCYPVASFFDPTHVGSREVLLGERYDEEATAGVSLERLVTPAAPPTFVWHTADDDVVPVVGAYRLGAALAENGVPHELHVYRSGPHGLGLAHDFPGAGEWTVACERFLLDLGWRVD